MAISLNIIHKHWLQIFLFFLLIQCIYSNECTELKSYAIELGCIILDFSPIPFAGSTCSLANAYYNNDTYDIAVNIIFLGLDYFSFGQAHWIKLGTTNVSKLANMVRRGKKIVQAFKVKGKKILLFTLGS
jgi:hypothetical protein